MEKHSDQIFIIGAGAIGKALAVCLQLAGRQVRLIRGSVTAGNSKTETIKVELPDGSVKSADILISTLGEHTSLDGIIALTNKSFGNEQLAEMLKGKTSQSPVILLQNGLGVEQPFIDRDFSQIYRCVLFVTSQSTSETSVRFKPVTTCPVGSIKGDPDLTDWVVAQLSSPLLEFCAEPDINQVVWKKTIINCVFNSVCPLLEADNGIFHRSAKALEIARTIIRECISVAKDQGIILQPETVEAALLEISHASDGQLISTLQDIRSHRPTEIDTLNLAVAAFANSLNKADAVKTTRLLGELVKIKADLNLKN